MRAWVDLEGAVNVRDIGGLPVEGGGVTAPGVLVRSDNLQGLTERDVARLVDELGVRVVVDLRTHAELDLEGPGPLVADDRVEIRHRSLYPEKGQLTDVMISRADGENPAVQYYLAYLRDRPDSIVGALEDIATADGSVLVHCAAGKDRTGVVVAMALAAVGVERDAIIADYEATGERIKAIMDRLRASETYRRDLEGIPDDQRMPRPEYLERVLEVLDERHGGAAGWLAEHGFDPAPLRERLLR
ncbi:tyrosine-protein phosphatase [Solirubrobacter taibaiensis]|nr:tyrosine-protein phosphatase [Solirubrobacter taibaiensis]